MLVVAALWIPPWLLLTWLTNMDIRGCGPTHLQTGAEKVGVTIVLTLLLAMLVAFRVRHSLRQGAALRVLHLGALSKHAGLRVGRDETHVRVESPADAALSELQGASESPISNDSEIPLRTRRHRQQKGD